MHSGDAGGHTVAVGRRERRMMKWAGGFGRGKVVMRPPGTLKLNAAKRGRKNYREKLAGWQLDSETWE